VRQPEPHIPETCVVFRIPADVDVSAELNPNCAREDNIQSRMSLGRLPSKFFREDTMDFFFNF
jgi:hypothetical protein